MKGKIQAVTIPIHYNCTEWALKHLLKSSHGFPCWPPAVQPCWTGSQWKPVEASGSHPTSHAGRWEGGEEKSAPKARERWEGAGVLGFVTLICWSQPKPHSSSSFPCSLVCFSFSLPAHSFLSSHHLLSVCLSFWDVAPSVCVQSHCKSKPQTSTTNLNTTTPEKEK